MNSARGGVRSDAITQDHLLGLQDLLSPVEPAFRTDPVRHDPVPAVAAFDEGGNRETHVRRAASCVPLPSIFFSSAKPFTSPQKWINLIKIGKTTLSTLRMSRRPGVRRSARIAALATRADELLVQRLGHVGRHHARDVAPEAGDILDRRGADHRVLLVGGKEDRLDPRIEGAVHQGQLELVVEIRKRAHAPHDDVHADAVGEIHDEPVPRRHGDVRQVPARASSSWRASRRR